MNTLLQRFQDRPGWSLEEFVQVLNDLLPQFLPIQKAHTRVREEVTPRMVRHYTSQGMVDEPLKAGREARYTYRHLLQLLVIRRLLAEGYGASAIMPLLVGKTNADMEGLLQGGVQLTMTTANPALAFLEQIKQRSSPDPVVSPISVPLPAHPNLSPNPTSSQWTRVEILPGLELHISETFIYPTSSQEQHTLLTLIGQLLFTPLKSRRQPP